MAIKVLVFVEGSADWITYNANARFRLDRDTTAAFASSTEVVTTVLTSGTERYEVFDTSGTSTSWYRWRIEDAADVALSAWSVGWQVLESRPIATLADVKQRLGTTSATDDDMLVSIIGGVNDAFTAYIGYYPGPSTDTARTLHGKDAVWNGHRMWIVGGVRSITTLAIAGSTGGATSNATSTDYILGPHASYLRPGEPYHYIEFVDVTTGSWGYFPHGYSNVVITGYFGWSSVPAELVQRATLESVRHWKARATGDADVVGSDEFGNQIISYRFPAELRRVLDRYRYPVAA